MTLKLNYLKHKNIILAISVLVVIAGLIYGFATGFTLDIDFKGGTRISTELKEEYNVSDIENVVKGACGQIPQVQATSAGDNSVTITTQTISEEESNKVVEALKVKYTNMTEPTIRNVQASYGKELLNTAIIAVVVSIVLLLVYIAIRFKTLGYTAALSAVLALLFDVCFLFAVYGVFKFPINSTFVAVILTIIGYSINDTIIIYDRIRENKRLVTKSSDDKDVINESIAQTMKRTIITSITTLSAIGIVLVFALVKDQETLKQFSIPLSIGIAEGTFSSIFIATNLWYSLDKLFKKGKNAKKA